MATTCGDGVRPAGAPPEVAGQKRRAFDQSVTLAPPAKRKATSEQQCQVTVESNLSEFARTHGDKSPADLILCTFERLTTDQTRLGSNSASFVGRGMRKLKHMQMGFFYLQGRHYQVHAEPHATPSRVPGANDEYQRMVGALAEHMGMGDADMFKKRAHFAELVRAHPIVLFLDLKWSTYRAKPAFFMAYLDRLRDEQSPLYPEAWRRDIPALQRLLDEFEDKLHLREWTP
jgi:hypothetical protein